MNKTEGKPSALRAAVKLRPATAADETFLLEVYGSTRADELALVPWNEEQKQAFLEMQFKAQREHYEKVHAEAEYQVIVFEGRVVGRLYVARKEKEIRILDLTLVPHERNRGIGTALVQEMMEEAAAFGKAVRIYVESFNPSLRFFERLGFLNIGQTGVHMLMQWAGSR